MDHVVTIRPNPHADNSRFKFENVCSCQWQMLCLSVEIADSHAIRHLSYHGIQDAKNHIVQPVLPDGGAPEPSPNPEEPRPLHHPEGALKPKVSATASAKALDAP